MQNQRGDAGGQTAAVAELILLGRRGQRDGFPGLSSVAATWVLFVDALHYLAHPHNTRLLLAWSQRGREQPPSPALVPAVAKSPPRHLWKLGPSQGSASDCLGPRLSGSLPHAQGALVGLPLPDPQEARAAGGAAAWGQNLVPRQRRLRPTARPLLRACFLPDRIPPGTSSWVCWFQLHLRVCLSAHSVPRGSDVSSSYEAQHVSNPGANAKGYYFLKSVVKTCYDFSAPQRSDRGVPVITGLPHRAPVPHEYSCHM